MNTPEPKRPSQSRDPKAPKPFFSVTKEAVAQSQLETAIWIWFHYGDPISILALATAANDCYSAMAKHAGQPNNFQVWFKSQPKGFQDRARFIQNFIKHGWKKLTGKAVYMPILGEVLICDSIDCHESVFGDKSPLMRLFVSRYVLENPHVVPRFTATILDTPDIDERAKWDRVQYLQEFSKRPLGE